MSADWQPVLVDGTAIGDIRYTLRTDYGALPEAQPRSVHHGSAEVLDKHAATRPIQVFTGSAPARKSRRVLRP